MKTLLEQVQSIPTDVKQLINRRLNEFQLFRHKPDGEWFSELCFCLLTANSKAKTAIAIQKELGFEGFANLPQEKITETIKRNKHRFHNNKASFIVKARQHLSIKPRVLSLIQNQGIVKTRDWLVENIYGLGYKEASHFLRNTGHENVSILDRHILSTLKEHDIIPEIPKSLSRSKYLDIEDKFNKISFLLNLSPAELDLHLWYLKTGSVLK